MRRRTSPSQHVFRNRRLGDIKAELEQLAMNPRRAPKRVFLAHTAHEISDFLPSSRRGCSSFCQTHRSPPAKLRCSSPITLPPGPCRVSKSSTFDRHKDEEGVP